MPSFTFTGFPEGSAVAISAVQDSYNASGSTPNWGDGGSIDVASVVIDTVEPAELVAPVGIWFEASSVADFEGNVNGPAVGEVYDPSMHEITWEWDFDDPGPFATPLNIPPAWNEKGKDYGKKAYHVFDTPGSYEVTLRGTQVKADGSGLVEAVDTVTVTILDPDTVYSGTRTICVSNQNNFTGAPAGAQLVTSLGGAFSALFSLGQTGRILLRAGESYDEGSLVMDDPMVNFRLGAFGAGAKPVLTNTSLVPSSGGTSILSFRGGSTIEDSVFYGLRFQGDWDATKETGDPRLHAVGHGAHNPTIPGGFTSVFYQCEFNGLSLYLDVFADGEYVEAVVDCDITNWCDYGVLAGSGNYNANSRLAIVGSAIHQAQDACKGGYGKVSRGIANMHGPLRYSDVMQCILSASDFYSASSWPSAPGDGIQPCLRLAASINGPGGQFINANRVVCEGGSGFGGIDSLDSFVELPGNHIFDMFLMIGDYHTVIGTGSDLGGTTFRNGLLAFLDMNRKSAPLHFFDMVGENPGAGNLDAPMRIHNCTFLNMSSATMNVITGDGPYNDLTLENNIHHAPNASPTLSAPIDLTATVPGVAPRNRGERIGPEKVVSTLGGSVSGSNGTTTMPYPAGTGPADYLPGGRHTVLINDLEYFFSYKGQVSLSFGASDITITNTSGTTWPGGQSIRIMLDQNTLSTNGSFGSPSTVPLPMPGPTSPALDPNLGLRAQLNPVTVTKRPRGNEDAGFVQVST